MRDERMSPWRLKLTGQWPSRVLACALLTTVGVFAWMVWSACTRFATPERESFLLIPAVMYGAPVVIAVWAVAIGLLCRWQAGDGQRFDRLSGRCRNFEQQLLGLTRENEAHKLAASAARERAARTEDAMRTIERRACELQEEAERAIASEATATGDNRAKTEFLANFGADIRIPLATILGFTDTLLTMGDVAKAPRDRIEALYAIKQKSETLLDRINDVVELCDIELDKSTATIGPCAPTSIVEEVRELMDVWARARGLCLVVEYEGELPETIQTDDARLRQILINLIGNAIKFTLRGDVRLLVSLVRSDDADPMIQFDVIDSGIGMVKERATDLAATSDSSEEHTASTWRGKGLGLAISRHYAEQLGGDLTVVDSLPGIGTRIRLTIACGATDDVGMTTPVDCEASQGNDGGGAVIHTGRDESHDPEPPRRSVAVDAESAVRTSPDPRVNRT